MTFLKDKINVAVECMDNDIILSEKEFKKIYHELGNMDSPDSEYLIDQLDCVKDTLTVPLHIAQHIHEIIES